MAATAEQMHAWIVRQIGTVESPRGSNCQPYSKSLGRPCEQWCADGLVAAARAVGLKLPSESASASAMYRGFHDAGRTGTVPRFGAFGFFHFPGETAGIDHVGWCESWTDHVLTSIDFNTAGNGGSQYNGGAVLRRNRDRSLVVAYGYPDYASSPTPPPEDHRMHVNAPLVAVLTHPNWATGSYIEVCADGGTFDWNGAPNYGSLGNIHLNKPITCAAVTPAGRGYWLVAADGGVFAFGDAVPFPNNPLPGQHLNAPVATCSSSRSGRGLYLAGADGGLYALGDAVFGGSVAYP